MKRIALAIVALLVAGCAQYTTFSNQFGKGPHGESCSWTEYRYTDHIQYSMTCEYRK